MYVGVCKWTHLINFIESEWNINFDDTSKRNKLIIMRLYSVHIHWHRHSKEWATILIQFKYVQQFSTNITIGVAPSTNTLASKSNAMFEFSFSDHRFKLSSSDRNDDIFLALAWVTMRHSIFFAMISYW